MSVRQRTVKIVQWDGPLPAVGEFIAARTRLGDPWKIRGVQIRRGGLLVLDLYRSGVTPEGVVIHPSARIQPSDPAGPPRIQQVIGSGPTAVMAASWRDPLDIKPNASHRPRRLTGFRRYCPLRRMIESGGSRQITEDHVRAADLFRADADIARFGLSTDDGHEGAATRPALGGPRSGPSDKAISQAEALDVVRRTYARFVDSHVAMLTAIVLANRSLHAWCADIAEREGKAPVPAVEMGKLVSILDILVDCYKWRIKIGHAIDEMTGGA